MFQYTKNNHIECSFSDGVLDFKHGKCNSHKSWREECKNVAQELYDLHGDKLIVTLSGGLDSEVVLHSFIANGIVPHVVIFRYERNLNLHDINYALRICAARQISPKIVDINVSRFFTTNLLDYANITKCSSPQLNLLMKSIDNLDGIPIIGAGENYLSRKEGEKEVYDLEEAKIAAIYKFYKNKEREIIPAFFQYTPEIMISYLQKESVYRWVETAKQQKYINSKKIKPSIIAEDFDIEPRGKLTGFELMESLDNKYRLLLSSMNLGDNGEQWTSFTDYIKGFGVDLLRDINYV
jgi:diphthamide synthase (EF-2-diphthine--ammonia ligase)